MKAPIGFVFDIEADDLYPAVSKVWYINLTDLQDDSKSLSVKPFEDSEAIAKIQGFVDTYPDGCFVVGHNILQYDLWAMWKILGVKPVVYKQGKDFWFGKEVIFIDSRYMSMFLNPDRPGHSLEDLGLEVNEPKMDYRQKLIDLGDLSPDAPEGAEFKFWHFQMQVYCNQDVKTNKKVFLKLLWKPFSELYQESIPESYRVSQKGFFLMAAQEFTGYRFDIEFAKETEQRIQGMIEEIASEIEPQLPKRPLKKGEMPFYTMPKNPYKKDGSFSHHMLKFIESHNAEVIDNFTLKVYDQVVKIESNKLLDMQLPMQLKDQDELKDFFLSLGWEPVFYNYQKGPDNKFLRDDRGQLIPTSPKLQEQGKIDPGLEELTGDLPKRVVRYLSLRNRLGVLQGWLNNPRLQIDARLPARSSKITNTHRQAHSIVCNVPKAEDGVLLGKEFRSLFMAEEGFLIAAADAVAGENFTEAHYTKKYPGGEEYVAELLSGDPHLRNATIFYPEKMKGVDISLPGVKDLPAVKPLRSKSKSGKYALTFGCSPGKLAKTLGLPEHKGKILYEDFWNGNPALKALKEAVEKYWETTGKKKVLPGIDGRFLRTRHKHSLLNVLFQSALAIVMDYALALYMDDTLGELYLDEFYRPYYIYKGFIVRRVCYYHDEAAYECQKDIAEEVSQLLAKAITDSSIYLGLRVPIQGEGKVGINWKEVH